MMLRLLIAVEEISLHGIQELRAVFTDRTDPCRPMLFPAELSGS